MRFLISAGEASGELYGSQLIAALRQRDPDAKFFGVAGERMRQAGCATVIDASEVAVVGLLEVVRHLPRIRRAFKTLLAAVDRGPKPDAAILVDFPDFNLRLARELHKRSIPVMYFVSPQVWAWRQGRLADIKRYVRKMLVIFPFEETFYEHHGVDAEYVGHPLAAAPVPRIDRSQFARQNALDPSRIWIALLPGSRHSEIRLNLPQMVRIASHFEAGCQFILPAASTISAEWLNLELGSLRAKNITVVQDARAALACSRAAVIASGTATVEATLAGIPFVVVYRVAAISWLLGRRLVRLTHFAMPNLIAGKEIVPEFIQSNYTAEAIVPVLEQLLQDGPQRSTMLADLAEVRTRLADPASGDTRSPADRAAAAILQSLGRS